MKSYTLCRVEETFGINSGERYSFFLYEIGGKAWATFLRGPTKEKCVSSRSSKFPKEYLL